jgi:hypothetical protein
VSVVAAAAAALTVVLLSPLALEEISSSKGVDWNRLSDIGAAYGFTSAIVSALALAGVAVSLIVQNRQARAEQVQGIRSYYLELVRLELDDMALFQPVWGDTDIADPHEQKRHVYADLMMNYAWMGFEIGTIRESLLRDMLAGMFTGEAGGTTGAELTPRGSPVRPEAVSVVASWPSWARSMLALSLPDRRPDRSGARIAARPTRGTVEPLSPKDHLTPGLTRRRSMTR